MIHYDLATKTLAAAKARDWKITTAESCTGGMISSALTDIPGSSSVFDRGFVTYSYPSKTDMLGVPKDMLEDFGAVSEPVARQMALGALQNSDANISIAVTGVAGPGADGAKAEGLVWFGLATSSGVQTKKMNFGAIGRDPVRTATVEAALDMLLTELAP